MIDASIIFDTAHHAFQLQMNGDLFHRTIKLTLREDQMPKSRGSVAYLEWKKAKWEEKKAAKRAAALDEQQQQQEIDGLRFVFSSPKQPLVVRLPPGVSGAPPLKRPRLPETQRDSPPEELSPRPPKKRSLVVPEKKSLVVKLKFAEAKTGNDVKGILLSPSLPVACARILSFEEWFSLRNRDSLH